MKHELSQNALEMIAERFRLLSEPSRLRIVYSLRNGEMSVTEITEALATSQPNTSKHLRMLQDSGILLREQRGNAVYYSLADESIFELCNVVCSSLGERLKRQANILSLA